MITTRSALPVAVAITFVLASCSGSSDDAVDDVDTPETVAEPVADETDDFTDADETEAETAPETTEPAAPDEPAATEPAEVDEPAPDESAPDEVDPDEVDPATTDPEATDTAEEPEPETDESAAAADVALLEWSIDAPTEYTAGEVTFNASNGGRFPHELVVIEGEGYEALPLAEGGAVIEEELPTGALIGRTGRLGGDETEALVVTLAPGSYVLVCNLGGGNNSHAGQGQRLDITVS